ncbi:ABC transporter permease subunit [Catellatospora tritici]|uniref:ABC transporter permease subunit n=1 Tax=Catellatospora tritici TaxID=2851566 RepID=UPI001C2CDDFA|nr:ABC transporter permease subunit [Catellatospora tritici]MBV1854317.1 ABC transporter permease [Catellatospora tritici]
MYADVAACHSDCTTAIDNFITQFRASPSSKVYSVILAVTYALPALIGIFWGAPLIARELEAGTHRVAWNQSITRTRWLAVKLALLAAITAVVAGLLSWAVTTWAQPVDSAIGDRITPLVFGARGIVPIGYAVFAFTLGTAAGALIRRSVPAMAATLGVYVAAVASMPLWMRAHLVPAVHETTALDVKNLTGIIVGQGDDMQVIGGEVANAWTFSNQTLTTSGAVFTGPADPTACGRNGGGIQGCQTWIGSLGLRQDVFYHPDSHFWALQWAETGVFLALSAMLAGLCFWWIRRRLT